MPRVKVTRNFQVTIPAEIREVIGLREGDYLDVTLDENNRIIMVKIPYRKRKTLRAGRKLTPEEIEKIIVEGLEETLI